MRIQLVSDLHLEHYLDGGMNKLQTLLTPDVDTLVIAGDFFQADNTASFLELVYDLHLLTCYYKHVVFVAGNHDFWGSSFIEAKRKFKELEHLFDNFYYLDNQVVTLEDVTFAGSTLWFKEDPLSFMQEAYFNDFRQIQNFKQEVYLENQLALNFFKGKAMGVDVWITHHLPATPSIALEHKGDPLNCFFLCDMSAYILEAQPKLHLHGHTHSSCDYWVDQTRVICNPAGYLRQPNREFNPHLVMEV